MSLTKKKQLTLTAACAALLLMACAIASVIALNYEAKVEKVEEVTENKNRLEDEVKALRKLIPLQETNMDGDMPLRIMEGKSDVDDPPKVLPVSPMSFKVGEWTETPWEGVNCFGVLLTETEVVVICEVLEPIRLSPHTHGSWGETVTMVEGILYGHLIDKFFPAGGKPFYAPAGVVHEPEFVTPARAIITWRKEIKK